MRWFKFYIGALLDEQGKFKDFTDEEVGVTVRLIALAGSLHSSGRFVVGRKAFDPRTILEMAGATSENCEKVFKKLSEIGTIKSNRGVFYLAGWAEYQDEWEARKKKINSGENSRARREEKRREEKRRRENYSLRS